MANRSWWRGKVFLTALFLLLVPALSQAQPESNPGLPSISQQLVREGDFAIRLHSALGLGAVQDETEAESGLGRTGVMPRNGWIADYPVTPDIVGELQKSVTDAATRGTIALDTTEALMRLNQVATEQSLNIRPQSTLVSEEPAEGTVPPDYPDPTVINNYYQAEGPPVVTYYTPPPDYYYLYGWIPYPFWWSGFWFPGYFILHDFHRSFRGHDRVSFISNHFNDLRGRRVYRVDPVARFNGRTYAGIGASGRRGFISTGVPRSQRTIFNAPRAQAAPGMRPLPGMRPSYRSSGGSERNFAPSTRRGTGGRTFASPSRGNARTFSAPSRGGGRSFSAPAGGGGRSFSAPAGGGGRSFSAPAPGGGAGRGMGGASGGPRNR